MTYTEADFNFWVEICCEECNQPEHVHFDCPICGIKHADSDIYGETPRESWDDGSEFGHERAFSKCPARFVPSGKDGNGERTWRLEP